MTKDNGGSAFPESYEGEDAPYKGIGDGMSLRDYFAAKAMQEMVHEYIVGNGPCLGLDHLYKNVPSLAYRMADAMIAERNK